MLTTTTATTAPVAAPPTPSLPATTVTLALVCVRPILHSSAKVSDARLPTSESPAAAMRVVDLPWVIMHTHAAHSCDELLCAEVLKDNIPRRPHLLNGHVCLSLVALKPANVVVKPPHGLILQHLKPHYHILKLAHAPLKGGDLVYLGLLGGKNRPIDRWFQSWKWEDAVRFVKNRV
jgi:hypothetical protein